MGTRPGSSPGPELSLILLLCWDPRLMVPLLVTGLPAIGGMSAGGGYLEPPGIDTEFDLKWPVVRVLTRGTNWGQRTGRRLMKTWRDLSLNSVCTRQMRAASMSGWVVGLHAEACTDLFFRLH